MFLSVSGRHVGAHLDGLQHGISIQISINLGKTFIHMYIWLKKNCCDLNLVGVFAYLPSLFSQILDFIMERFWFLFWSVLNSVTLKTSNRSGNMDDSNPQTFASGYFSRSQIVKLNQSHFVSLWALISSPDSWLNNQSASIDLVIIWTTIITCWYSCDDVKCM